MRKFSIFLLGLLALNLSFGEETKTTPNELEELQKQKEMLTDMRAGLSEQDQKALKDDFKERLAEIDSKIAELEKNPETDLSEE